MVTIIEQYTQFRFEKLTLNYKYLGTCDVKDNNIISIQISITDLNGTHVGNISNRNDNTSVSLIGNSKLEDLSKFSDSLIEIRSELSNLVIKQNEL